MGLDMVELEMAIEDEFGVSAFSGGGFPETVGEMHEVIREALNRNMLINRHSCPSIPAYFSLRDMLQKLLNSDQQIRPSTSLSDLLSQKCRRKIWDQLQSEFLVKLPPLRTDPRYSSPIVLTWIGVCAFILVYGTIMAETSGLLFAAFVAIPIVSLGLLMLLSSLPTVMPAQCSTVGDVVRRIVPSNRSIQAGSRTDKHNWDRLLEIISDQLDVPRAEIYSHSHFVRDLKCG